MSERLEALEERLQKAEATLRILGDCLAISPEGGVMLRGPLRVVDPAGRTLLEVSPGEDGSTLRLMSSDGAAMVVLDTLSTGGSLTLRSRGGQAAAALFADESGGDLTLYDTDGELQFSAP